MEKKTRKKLTAFNGMTPRDWTKSSRSVWTARDVSSPRQKHHLEHGATFPIALAERAITMYSKKNDLIFDPFLGIGSTLSAAMKLGRKGLGFELYAKFAKTANEITKQASFGDNGELVKQKQLSLLMPFLPLPETLIT